MTALLASGLIVVAVVAAFFAIAFRAPRPSVVARVTAYVEAGKQTTEKGAQ